MGRVFDARRFGDVLIGPRDVALKSKVILSPKSIGGIAYLAVLPSLVAYFL